jgi:hypothetical protein
VVAIKTTESVINFLLIVLFFVVNNELPGKKNHNRLRREKSDSCFTSGYKYNYFPAYNVLQSCFLPESCWL